MTKVLITGITGMVGSHLADYILDNNLGEVIGMKRWRSSLDNIEHILGRIELHDADLTDLSSLINLLNAIKPDRIHHLAAQSYVPASYTYPVKTLMDNGLGTLNLLEAVRITGQNPLIHICSSSEVYGQVRQNETPITENNPLRPASPYAVSKVTEDMYGWMYHTAYGLNTIRTRMFTHTGPRRGDVFVTSSFAKQIALIEAGKQDCVIRVGNLESVRTFLDVRDAVRAYWLLDGCTPGAVYNIGGDETMTIGRMLDWLLAMSNVTGIRVEPTANRLRPTDVTMQIPSSDNFKSVTGWEPEIPFSTTLGDLLDYWRARV